MIPPHSTYGCWRSFAPGYTGGLPALLYHKIGGWRTGVRRRGLYVNPRSFRAQLHELRSAGFRSARAEHARDQVDARRVVITFDDGFASVLEVAAPILREVDFTAINFLVSGELGGVNTWDLADGERAEPLMDEAQVRDWLAAGHEIGAHSVTHAHLPKLTRTAAREEIFTSKKALEDRFSRAVTDFAYPFGEFDDAVRDLVAEAGFARAWTVEPAVVTRDASAFMLPRFPVVVSLRRPLNLLRSLLPLWR